MLALEYSKDLKDSLMINVALLQSCADGTGCKRRVCFFAHVEVRSLNLQPVTLDIVLDLPLTTECPSCLYKRICELHKH